MLQQCVICGAIIWHTELGLCLEHQPFRELCKTIALGERSDWFHTTNALTDREMLTLEACAASHSWLVDLDDINRMARYWLDGWHDDGDDGDDGGYGIAA